MKITTNNHKLPLLSGYDLTPAERADGGRTLTTVSMISHDEKPTPTNDVEMEPPAKPRGKKRKGKGARQRQNDSHRTKKNEEFAKELEAEIMNMKISLGYKPDEVFGDRMHTDPVMPTLEVPIATETAAELCVKTATVLHSICKLPPSSQTPIGVNPVTYDAETLRNVTALQIESKIYHARVGSTFVPDLQIAERAERTAKLFEKAVSPLSVYIDQIGQFNVDGQTFVPTYAGNGHDLLFDQEVEVIGPRMLSRDHLGRVVQPRYDPQHEDALVASDIIDRQGNFNPEFLQHPIDFPYLGVIEFDHIDVPRVNPQLPEIAVRYCDLMARVEKRILNGMVGLKLSGGKGCESQLVMTRHIHDGVSEVWSPRKLAPESFMFGAIFRFGGEGILARSAPIQECIIDISAGLDQLAGILSKRVK